MLTKNSVPFLLLLAIFLCCTSCTSPGGDATNLPKSTNQNFKESATPIETFTTQPTQEETTTPELPTRTQESKLFLPGESILLIRGVVNDIFGYYLVNTNTGEFQRLLADGEPVFEVYDWLENSCELIVVIAHSGHIVSINLNGLITSTIYNGNDYGGDIKIPRRILSPDHKFLAYIVGSGYHDYYRYEVQDILIKSLEAENNSLIQFSSNGGVWDMEWSPDGSMIAYTDYDDFGIMQLYAADPDGTDRIQISNHQHLSLKIHEIRWSVEGDAIAYHLENSEDYLDYVRVYRFSQLDKQFIEFGPYKGIADFWWHSGNKLGIFSGDIQSKNTWKIFWYQAFSGSLISSMNELDTPSQDIFIPKPIIGTDSIGYFNQFHWFPNTDSWFYIYDFNSSAFTSYQNFESFNEFEELRGWFPTMIIPEEKTCFQ